jgi:hypothetical protein
MAALKDTRHEAFAWACAGGLNRSAALAAASFKPASLSAFGD